MRLTRASVPAAKVADTTGASSTHGVATTLSKRVIVSLMTLAAGNILQTADGLKRFTADRSGVGCSRRKDVRASINGTSFGNALRIRTDDLNYILTSSTSRTDLRYVHHLWFMVRKWRLRRPTSTRTTTSVLAVLGVRCHSIAMRYP